MPPRINATAYRSPCHNARPASAKVEALVLHTTEGYWPSDIAWLSSKDSEVSAHYVISPAGDIYQLVDDHRRAWHAGIGTYLGRSDWNSFSVSVEISHVAGYGYPLVQTTALTDLCRHLIARYAIPQSYVVAHRWIAPGRRNDPSNWPDKELRAWIAALYAPPARRYKLRCPAAIFETPTGSGPIALGGTALLERGAIVEIDEVKDGWAHVSDQRGFVPIAVLDAV